MCFLGRYCLDGVVGGYGRFDSSFIYRSVTNGGNNEQARRGIYSIQQTTEHATLKRIPQHMSLKLPHLSIDIHLPMLTRRKHHPFLPILPAVRTHRPPQVPQPPPHLHYLTLNQYRRPYRYRAQIRGIQRPRHAQARPEARPRDEGQCCGGAVIEEGGDAAAVHVVELVAVSGLDDGTEGGGRAGWW